MLRRHPSELCPARTASGWSWPLCAFGALIAAGGLSTVAGCSGTREHNAVFVRSPAYGRPETCPEHRVDTSVGLGPSADSTPCSFDDARGGGLVQLRGTVLLEASADQAVPIGVEQARVVVVDASGKQVGRATTDAQGSYSVSLNLSPGAYELQVANADTGEVLGTRSVVVSDATAPAMRGLDIILPVDKRLRD